MAKSEAIPTNPVTAVAPRQAGPVTYKREGAVGVILVDRPPVNAINVAVRGGIVDTLARFVRDGEAKIALLVCVGRTFLSGADLNEFDHVPQGTTFHEMLTALSECPKPVVASLHGSALGGGLETALACHYRCAVRDARMGFPEITLGLIPGAEGTQRMPRLIGALKTLELMLKGSPVGAEEAKRLGIIDRIIDGTPFEGGMEYAIGLAATGAKPRPARMLKVDTNGFDQAGIAALLKQNERALRGRTTQFEAIKAVQAAVGLPFEEGLKVEKELSDATLVAPESLALRHIFFAERAVSQIPGLGRDTKPMPIGRVGVVGAGTMGSGIAMAFANAGHKVTLVDVDPAGLARGQASIKSNYEQTVARGRMTEDEAARTSALIQGTTKLDEVKGVDLIVEAVFEDMALKKRVLGEIDKIVGTQTILASNTSTLSVTELGAATGRPGKVVGLHFFSPAHVMRLLEIVRGKTTSNETLVTALDIARKIRKTGVVAGDAYGFIGNRMMQDGYFREAEVLLLEGASPEQIDRVMENFGFAMGPNRVNDMGGVDVGTRARQQLAMREARPDPYFVVSDTLTKLGRLGQKTGKGVYRYEPGSRDAIPDPEVTPIIEKLAAERQITRRTIPDAEIEERCVFSLINVGAIVLDQGIAYRSGDIDVVWTSGYGFPRYKGGPMFHGDSVGLARILERVAHYHTQYGYYWRPAPLLERLVREGRTFEQWDKART
jgi:3-hydroxyacyl-CoA dehydrogenase